MPARNQSKRKSSKSLYSSPYLVGSGIFVAMLLLINLPATTTQPSGQVKSSFQIARGDSAPESENEVENETENENDDLVEIENKDGELHLSGKDSNGTEFEIENNLESRKLKVKTATGEAEVEIEAEDGIVQFKAHGFLASSKFPLSFDKTTGALFVRTGNGTKQIRILPDEASSVAQSAGIIDKLSSIELESNTQEGTESIVFKVKGIKNLKLFGLIPVNENVAAQISSQDASVLSTQEPLWARLFSFLFSEG